MAEESKNVIEQEVPKVATEEEVKDRGLFDFMGKKEETKPEETIESEFEHKAQISEPKQEEEEEEKKPSLLEKLHRSDSSSSSSSEEEGEDGEKKKKKKKKKDKKKTTVEGEVKTEEEKKGFMEKLKEKLPGHGKKTEDASAVGAAPVVVPPVEETHPVEKKGILEKIKEKLPGYHAKTVEEEKKKDEN